MIARSSRLHRVITALAVIAPMACSGGQSRTNAASGGRAQGPVRLFTDTDFITDVASTSEHVYVGTNRGLLRYPAAGGTPERLWRDAGLPDDEILAVSTSEDGTNLWVATSAGVGRMRDGRFATAGTGQPDVGRPTALLAHNDEVFLGGTRGIARFDGQRWLMLTDRYQVTSLARAGNKLYVGTASNGLLVLSEDLSTLDEHGAGAGIPEQMVRDVVALASGKVWCLVQSPTGMKLAHFDGRRWYGYTSREAARGTWLSLLPSRDNVALVTSVGVFDVVLDQGEELAATEAASEGGARQIALQPTVIEPPPPPAPPTPPAPPPRRGRRPAARPPARPAPGRAQHAPVVFLQVGGDTTPAPVTPPAPPAADAGAAVATADASVASAPATPAAQVPAPAASGDAGVPTAPPASAPAGGDAGAVASAPAGGDAGAAAPVALAPIPVRDIPALAFPIEAQRGGPTIDAPTYGLVRASVDVAPDVVRADAVGRDLFVARTGLGVSRLAVRAGAAAMDFRTHDLAMQRRALSIATDSRNNVWLVGEDGGPVRYTGTTFSRVELGDARLHPLVFWSRGSTVVSIARVGDTNVLRGFKLEGNAWRRVVEGPVETYGPGTIDAKFLSVDSNGRFWVGLRVLPPAGAPANTSARELGVAVLSPDSPVATQYNYNIAETGGENGARRAPSDLTAVEFDRENNAFFASPDGLVMINGQGVRRFREPEGVRGDFVSDLARALGDRIYFCTPEGLGMRAGTEMEFPVTGSSAQPRPIALATDTSGNLWGAGPRGLWKYDGQNWQRVGRAQGLTTEEFNDLAIDSQNRVWLSTQEGIVLFDPAIRQE